jgi:hypothetical protein
MLFRPPLGLSNIVGAEEIQGRSSGVAVIRSVNLLQTSTSIQRKNKPSARWEATSQFDPKRPIVNVPLLSAIRASMALRLLLAGAQYPSSTEREKNNEYYE